MNDESAQTEAEGIFREALTLYENDVRQQTSSSVRSVHAISRVKDPKKERVYEYYARAVNLAQQHNEKEAEISAILATARTVSAARGRRRASREWISLYEQAESVDAE